VRKVKTRQDTSLSRHPNTNMDDYREEQTDTDQVT
jgi:hypothetical protein